MIFRGHVFIADARMRPRIHADVFGAYAIRPYSQLGKMRIFIYKYRKPVFFQKKRYLCFEKQTNRHIKTK